MKLNGETLSGPNVEFLVLPRGNGKDIVFKFQAILDTKRFSELVKIPKPGQKMLPGRKMVDDTEDPGFQAQVSDYATLRFHYMVLESIKATEGLTWETVIMDDPSTWGNWETEMKASGFNKQEIQMIQITASAANSLDQGKLDEARARFLASLAEATPAPSSPTVEQ